MITKQTVVDQIEITRNSTLQVRVALELVENGVVLSHKWHRAVISPNGDSDMQIAAVNEHLSQMGEQPVSEADIVRIKAYR